MRNFGAGRLVRICDKRTRSVQDGYDACSWLFVEGKLLSQRTADEHLRQTSWPYKGFPIVAAGTHGGKGLVMFGVCKSLAWQPFSDSDDIYHAQIDVAWEDRICWIEAGTSPSEPLPRSNAALTRAEYTAWRAQATDRMDASGQSPLE